MIDVNILHVVKATLDECGMNGRWVHYAQGEAGKRKEEWEKKGRMGKERKNRKTMEFQPGVEKEE